MDKKRFSLLGKFLIVIFGVLSLIGFVFGMMKIEQFFQEVYENSQFEIQNQNAVFQKQVAIKISEVMSANEQFLLDGDGRSSDWIEFYHGGDESINLKNAGLSTSLEEPFLWKFPDYELLPGEFLVIFASGKDAVDSAGQLHTNFKISALNGETIYFTSTLGTLLGRIEVPPLSVDVSYGCDEENQWFYYNHPTPYEVNGSDGQLNPDFQVQVESPFKINEYMTSNRSVLMDEDSNFGDWLEIKNTGEQTVSLKHLFLTDDPTDLRKWEFPDVSLAPQEILLLFAFEKDDAIENIHTNFRLSSIDTLILSNQYNEILDEIKVVDLVDDVSYGLVGEEWFYFSIPTPGKENDTHAFAEPISLESKVWDVVISEVMGQNNSVLADSEGNFSDWIEFRNLTAGDLNLKGFTLSNDADFLDKFVFSDFVIPAFGQRIVFADDELFLSHSDFYVPFSIGRSGERLFLCDLECDEPFVYETGFLGKDISSGLNENLERVFFDVPTPNSPNSLMFFNGYVPAVEFSVAGGEVETGTVLELSVDGGGTIFYTMDGSEPAPGDALYTSPITLDISISIRAMAIRNGDLPSQISTRSFVVGIRHDLPIVALSTDPENMFGVSGIYANPFDDIEKPVHFELYEKDGLALSFDAGFEIFGGTSQKSPQKSFAFHLKKEYGIDEFNYPLFEGNDVTRFKHFLLRTSGQDSTLTKIRDSFIQRAIEGVIDVDTMDTRPCVVYINGEYWGLYNIREKINEDYLASHHGVDADDVDLLVWNGHVMAGDATEYKALIDYVKTHDLSKQEYYDVVVSQIDVDEFIDYLIVQCYFGNTDSGNIKFWRVQENGKWRWILYDMDWALFTETYTWNNIGQIFNPDGMGMFDWIDTSLHMGLIKNDGFKKEFIERYAAYTNTFFATKRLLSIFDEMVEEIVSEMPAQLERWPIPSNYSPWEVQIANMRLAIIEKPELEKQHLQEFFYLSDERISTLFPE